MLDVGQGDSILIISPEGKVVLVDAGDTGRGKAVLADLKEAGVEAIDLFIATHAHADHIGAADEVMKAIPVRAVLDSGVQSEARGDDSNTNANRRAASTRRNVVLPTTKAYQDYLAAIEARGAQFTRAEPDQRFEIGGGAVITVLAPSQPLFTADELRSGGNVPNANSVVVRLDYGDFSMILTGDAEAQTEARIMRAGKDVRARVLKVGHHGSRYATSEDFLRRVKPEIALISDGETNRYGHPNQEVLDRLRAANVRVYRTDLQGDITITTNGKGTLDIKTEREPNGDLYTGREPERDDSTRRGFISYADDAPPKNRNANQNSTNGNNNRNTNGRAATSGR
jgi:competence protein ComEC